MSQTMVNSKVSSWFPKTAVIMCDQEGYLSLPQFHLFYKNRSNGSRVMSKKNKNKQFWFTISSFRFLLSSSLSTSLDVLQGNSYPTRCLFTSK
jgi:hypothetical protein